jgi:polyisoprenoid-binding protein YceI
MFMKKLMQLMLLGALSLSQAYAASLDTAGSVLKWKGSKGAAGFKLGSHYGKISFKEGSLEEKDGKLLGGEFVVDMNNFTVDDLSGEWAEKFIGHMKSSDFFQTDKHPTSKLKIKNVKGNAVTADLTVNGVTNEVKFDYKKDGNAYAGKLVFDRTKFNMNYGNDSSLGDKFIHKEVELEFSVKAK